jgi:hypothetical protein
MVDTCNRPIMKVQTCVHYLHTCMRTVYTYTRFLGFPGKLVAESHTHTELWGQAA